MDKTIEDIYKQTEQLFVQIVSDFLNSNKSSVKIPRLPIEEIRKILKKLDCKCLDDWDSNGYSVDFWDSFQHPVRGKLSISGDLWYNKCYTLVVIDNE